MIQNDIDRSNRGLFERSVGGYRNSSNQNCSGKIRNRRKSVKSNVCPTSVRQFMVLGRWQSNSHEMSYWNIFLPPGHSSSPLWIPRITFLTLSKSLLHEFGEEKGNNRDWSEARDRIVELKSSLWWR